MERRRKLIHCAHLNGSRNERQWMVVAWRIDCCLLLPHTIQAVDLCGIALVVGLTEDPCTQVNDPGRFLIGCPGQPYARREVGKAARSGLHLVAKSRDQAETRCQFDRILPEQAYAP